MSTFITYHTLITYTMPYTCKNTLIHATHSSHDTHKTHPFHPTNTTYATRTIMCPIYMHALANISHKCVQNNLILITQHLILQDTNLFSSIILSDIYELDFCYLQKHPVYTRNSDSCYNNYEQFFNYFT